LFYLDPKKRRADDWAVGEKEEEEETADEKRIRLAKEYLETFKDETEEQVTDKLRQTFVYSLSFHLLFFYFPLE
jgi:hypothetical protein